MPSKKICIAEATTIYELDIKPNDSSSCGEVYLSLVGLNGTNPKTYENGTENVADFGITRTYCLKQDICYELYMSSDESCRGHEINFYQGTTLIEDLPDFIQNNSYEFCVASPSANLFHILAKYFWAIFSGCIFITLVLKEIHRRCKFYIQRINYPHQEVSYELTDASIPSEEERKEARRLKILTNIIHKKVLPKRDNNNSDDNEKDITLILPHETTLSERAILNDAPYLTEMGNQISEREDAVVNDISSVTDFPIPIPSPQQGENEQNVSGEITNFGKDDIRELSMKSLIKGMSTRSERWSSMYNPKTCPICLENYKAGDEIAWSKNENCYHAFHLDCVLDWLMDNDDCPLCRRNYLCDDYNV